MCGGAMVVSVLVFTVGGVDGACDGRRRLWV